MASVVIETLTNTYFATKIKQNNIVFVSQSIGYAFFVETISEKNVLRYKKTTDGGETWGSTVTVGDVTDTLQNFVVYWGKESIASSPDNLIHIAYSAATSGSDTVLKYRNLDPDNSDTLSSIITVSGTIALHAAGIIMLCQNSDKKVFVSYQHYNQSVYHIYKSNVGITEFSKIADCGLSVATYDTHTIVCHPTTAQDMVMIVSDDVNNKLLYRVYDESADSWSSDRFDEIDDFTPFSNDNRVQIYAKFSNYDDKVYLVGYDYANQDIQFYSYDGTDWTQKTNVRDNIGDNVWSVVVGLDQYSGAIYVAWAYYYSPGYYRIVYRKSTDGGSTWDSDVIAYGAGIGYCPQISSGIGSSRVFLCHTGVEGSTYYLYGATLKTTGPIPLSTALNFAYAADTVELETVLSSPYSVISEQDVTSGFAYKVYDRFTVDTNFAYYVLARLDLDAAYSVIASHDIGMASPYSVITNHTIDIGFAYNYAILETVDTDFDYTVIAEATEDIGFAYAVIAEATEDIGFAYKIVNEDTTDLEFGYNVVYTNTVDTDFDYITIASNTKELGFAYGVITSYARALTTDYDVYSEVTTDLDFAYNVTEVSTYNYPFDYKVVTANTVDVSFAYGVIALHTIELEADYSVILSSTIDIDFDYSIYDKPETELGFGYVVITENTENLDFDYNAYQYHDVELGFAYGVATAIPDITIETSGQYETSGEQNNLVFVTKDIGYAFYIKTDIASNELVYKKTTDGGETWGSLVRVDTTAATESFNIFYGKWGNRANPDNLIHIVYFNSTLEDILYTTLDPSDDSQSSVVTVDSAFGYSDCTSLAISQNSSGKIFINANWCGTSARNRTYRSNTDRTSFSQTATASVALEYNYRDWFGFAPHPTIEDDMVLVWYDSSADTLNRNIYDDSGDSWGGWATIDTGLDDFTNVYANALGCEYDYFNNLIVVTFNKSDDSKVYGSIKCYSFNGSIWTIHTNPYTDPETSSTYTVKVHALAVDSNTGYWYVVYGIGAYASIGEVDIKYVVSNNQGTTWSEEYDLSYTIDDHRFVHASTGRGDSRIAACWYNSDLSDWLYKSITDTTADILNLSFAYGVIASHTTTLDFAYKAINSNTLNLTSDYDVIVGNTVTADFDYGIIKSDTIDLTSDYDVIQPDTVDLSTEYQVIVSNTEDIGSEYVVIISDTVDVDFAYGAYEPPITLDFSYAVIASYTIELGQDYDVIQGDTVTSDFDYEVVNSHTWNIPFAYAVINDHAEDLVGEYQVQYSRTRVLAFNYKVDNEIVIELEADYDVIQSDTVDMEFDYAVIASHTTDVVCDYVVISSYTTDVDFDYDVSFKVDVEFDYAVIASHTLGLGSDYDVIQSDTLSYNFDYDVKMGGHVDTDFAYSIICIVGTFYNWDYAVIANHTEDVSSEYQVYDEFTIDLEQDYDVIQSDTVTTDFDYAVIANHTIDVSSEYQVIVSYTKNLTTDYDVYDEITTDLGFAYAVIEVAHIDLASDYDVVEANTLDLTADYVVIKNYSLTVDFDYDAYQYETVDLGFAYGVIASHTATVDFDYAVIASHTIDLTFAYIAVQQETVALSSDYDVTQYDTVDITCDYAVQAGGTTTLDFDYYVERTHPWKPRLNQYSYPPFYNQ